MTIAMVRKANWLVVCLLATLKYVDWLIGIMIHFNWPIEEFAECLYFDMITMTVLTAFALNVIRKILGHIM